MIGNNYFSVPQRMVCISDIFPFWTVSFNLNGICCLTSLFGAWGIETHHLKSVENQDNIKYLHNSSIVLKYSFLPCSMNLTKSHAGDLPYHDDNIGWCSIDRLQR